MKAEKPPPRFCQTKLLNEISGRAMEKLLEDTAEMTWAETGSLRQRIDGQGLMKVSRNPCRKIGDTFGGIILIMGGLEVATTISWRAQPHVSSFERKTRAAETLGSAAPQFNQQSRKRP